jgi:hypothetical protein
MINPRAHGPFQPDKTMEDLLCLIDLPLLLGERSPSEAQARRAIRHGLLLRLSFAHTDHEAIRHRAEIALSEAAVLRDQLRDKSTDEQKRRQCLAVIAEAGYLSSDDEGRLVQWLRKWCIDLTGITKDTALLPLALKAFGPYDYDGDARRRRISDQQVSRDHNSIRRLLSPKVLPPDLVNTWNQPGCGINASSRPRGAADDPCRSKPVPVAVKANMHEHFTRQCDGSMIWLVDKKGNRCKLQAMVADPNIVKATTHYIRQPLAAKRKHRATRITPQVAKKPFRPLKPSAKNTSEPEIG